MDGHELILTCIQCNKEWIDQEHYSLEADLRNGHCCHSTSLFWVTKEEEE